MKLPTPLQPILDRVVRASDARRVTFRTALWWAYVAVGSLPIVYFFGFTRSELASFLARLAAYAGDISIAGLILLAALGFGGLVLTCLRVDKSEALGLVYAVLIGLGLLALVTLGLGVVGLLFAPLFLILLAAGVLLTIVLGSTRVLVVRFWSGLRDAVGQIQADGLSSVATLAASGGVLYCALTNAMVPPFEWDSIAYHLAVPELYLQSHRITYVPSIQHSNWPFNMEMLYTVSLAIGSERVPGFVTLSFLVLGELLLVLAGTRFLGARAGALAAAFYAGLPVVHRYAGTADVDVPLAVFAFAALLAGYEGVTRADDSWLAVSGLLAGFAAGCKLTGAITALLLGLFLLIAVVAQRRLGFDLQKLVGFAAPAALVVFPWYLKSWIVTGNPVWPFLLNVFPSRNWDAYGEQLLYGFLHSPGTGTSLRSLVRLPWNMTVTNRFGAPLGPLLLALSPISFVVKRRKRLFLYLAGFSFAATLIWFFQTQQLRFLSPVLLALSLLAGAGAACLMEVAPPGGRALCAIALAAWFVVESPLAVAPERAAVEASLPYIRGQMDEKTFLSQRIDVFPVFDYANTHLPSNAQVFLLLYEDRGFYLHRPYFWGNPISQRVIRFEQIETAADLDRTLRTMGFSHVIVNPNWDLPREPYAKHFHQLVADYTARYLQPLFSANGVTLYRVRS